MKNILETIFKKEQQNDAGGAMTVQELIARFPEISKDLHSESILKEYAATFGDLLRQAQDPSACSQQYSAGNHYYLKLIGPLKIYMYGLSTKEKVLSQMRGLLDQYAADPEGFVAGLLPSDTAAQEVRGPDCE